jgi:NADH:ubiquinone oxidoreductase subunit 5 (subunit L)/multisubunit Na+/H+ antiporter MnhA subunit
MTASPQVSFGHLVLWAVAVLAASAIIFVFARDAVRRSFEVLRRGATAFDAFDAEFIDRTAVNGTARLARLISKIAVLCDAWLVEGLVNSGASMAWALSIPVRRIQNGLVQSYVLCMVIGLIGLLGYGWYLAHHAIR